MRHEDIKGAKGGGSKFTTRPDNLRSEDAFEGLLGLGQGPWKGPTKGFKSLRINDTPFEDATGTTNFKDWVATYANGDPALWPQKPLLRLGTAATPVSIGVVLANPSGTGTPVVRSVPNTGADHIDLRFVVSALYNQTKSGIGSNTMHVQIRMKPTGTNVWINIFTDNAANEPTYSEGGLDGGGGIAYFISRALYNASGDRVYTGTSGSLTITGKTTSPYVKEVRVAVPNEGDYANVGWDIECTLLEVESVDADPNFQKRTISWDSAAAVYNDPLGIDPAWKGLSWLTVAGQATDQINDVPEVWGEYDTKIVSVPPTAAYNPTNRFYTGAVWDGSWVKSFTMDPAWIMADAIADPLAGIAALAPGAYLNKWDALELSKWCSELVKDGDVNQAYYIANIATQGKADVRVAVGTNVTISAPGATLSGITMAASNRVLLYGQTLPQDNGIYVWNGAASAMTRATDCDASAEFLGAAVYVTEGLNEWRWFKQYQTVTTVGTTANRWVSVHPRYCMNVTTEQPVKADEMIRNMAGAVGAVAWDSGNGEWRCKVDKAETPVAVFTEENIEGEFVYSHTDVDTRYNDITVVFRNAEFDYREDRVRVFDQPDIDLNGHRPTTVVAIGCTNRQEAARRGMLRLRSSINEFRLINFTTNRQGRTFIPLHTVLVADKSLGYEAPTGSTALPNTDARDHTTGRIIAMDGPRTTVTLRDALRLEPGATYKIVLTVPNPAYNPNPSTAPATDWEKPTITIERDVAGGSPRGDVKTVTLTSALPADTPLNAPIALSATGLPALPKTYRIININYHEDSERVTISGIEVDTGKWAAADTVNPSFLSAQIPDPYCPPPIAPAHGVLTVRTFPGNFSTKRVLEIDWERPVSKFIAGYEIEYQLNNGPKFTLSTTDTIIEIQDPAPGTYDVSIFAVDRRGQRSVALTASTSVLDTVVNGSSIAADEVLSITEKQTSLQKLYADLEARYADLFARATAMGLSTTAVAAARTNWLNLLASYAPAWNDYTTDTTIFVNAFSDRSFPSLWTLANMTTAANGVFTTLTDASSGAQGNISRSVTQTAAATQYSFGVVVKKDAVGQATRNPVVTFVTSGGTLKTGTLAFDTATGASAASTLDASGVLDLGDSWFAWGTFTTNANNTGLAVNMYSAGSVNLSLTLSNTPTGSIDARLPVLTKGAATKLGRSYLSGLLNAYSGQMTALFKAISQLDAVTSIVLDPIPDTTISADSSGTIKSGELPRQVGFTASNGVSSVTTLGTWSRTVTSGITCTIGASTGILEITAMTAAEVIIPISFTYAGVTRTYDHKVTRVNDMPDTSGGGGFTQSTTVLGSTTGTSYDTTNSVSATLKVKAGAAGQVKCDAFIGFKRSSSSAGFTGAFGKWQWRVLAGSFADITAEIADAGDAETVVVGGEPTQNFPGGFDTTMTMTKTGLTNGTEYEFRFLWRRTDVSGAAADIYRHSGSMVATGS